jgi:alpha-beta hydrolase superfamily lysophospholipase
MEIFEFDWKNSEGQNIHAVNWHISNPKAVICLVHGFGEHIERYHHFATYFAENEVAVLANDHVGHGKSDGKRGHAASYSLFLEEVERLIFHAKARYPNKPVFIYGHSMGGNIVLNHLIRRRPAVKGIIATGPWIQLTSPPNRLLLAIGRWLRKVRPTLSQPSGIKQSYISRNLNVVRAYKNDPLVFGTITAGMGMDMTEAADFLNEFSGAIYAPLLIMHGSDDKLTSPKASEAFSERLMGNVTYKKWQGMYHEIHNEDLQKDVFDLTLLWMNNVMKIQNLPATSITRKIVKERGTFRKKT